MNCDAVQAVLMHSRSANAARMVLIALAARSNDKGLIINLPILELCKDANATDRTVKSAIAELRDELKELKTERPGAGRGHTFDFDIGPLLEKVKILHASDKGAEVSPIKPKGENVAPIPPDKGENNVENGADISPLSDAKGEDFTGTPIAPLSAKNTSKENTKSLASARSARAKDKPEPVELPEWLTAETWGEWEQFNRERRKPLPPTTVKAQLKQLAEFRARGMPPEAVIAQSIARNWQGLFPVEERKGNAATNGHRNGKPTLTNRADEYADYFGGDSPEEHARQNHS